MKLLTFSFEFRLVQLQNQSQGHWRNLFKLTECFVCIQSHPAHVSAEHFFLNKSYFYFRRYFMDWKLSRLFVKIAATGLEVPPPPNTPTLLTSTQCSDLDV